jgi:predicted metalloprotease with PDZ domain
VNYGQNHRRVGARGTIAFLRATPVARILAAFLLSSALIAALCATASASGAVDPDKVYKVIYRATLDPQSGMANASLTIDQPRRLVRGIELAMPRERYQNIRPASQIEIKGDRVIWRPLKNGSVLRYDFVIDRKRDNGLADARITATWAMLKLDHLFPPASARVVKGATSDATMELKAPEGWGIETPFGRGAGQTLDVSNPDRLFDRPLGWMIAGKLGSRSDEVDGRTVRVASPLGSGIKANDMVAFLLWTLPSMIDVLPEFPDYLLIVSGTTDMWRGGLSGFHSLYVHAERPMISGNRTSTLLHELFHVGSRLSGSGGADWIVEGLAEYYSVEVLFRSGGISQFRYKEVFDDLEKLGAGLECKATDRSSTKQNARAALVMRALDQEIRAATGDNKSLIDVVHALVRADRPVTNADFRALATDLVGKSPKALADCP